MVPSYSDPKPQVSSCDHPRPALMRRAYLQQEGENDEDGSSDGGVDMSSNVVVVESDVHPSSVP